MSILGTGQRAPACIYLSYTIPQMTLFAPKTSTTPDHRHIYTFTIHQFVCLTAMNMKYLLCTSCTGCVKYTMIFNKCMQVTKEKCTHFTSQSHGSFSKKTKNVHKHISSMHTYSRVKMGWYLVPLQYQSYNNTNMINSKCLLLRLYV